MTNSFYVRIGKRWLDAVIALIGLIVLSPLLVIVALAVRFTSRGPALFRQIRVGQFGKPFRIFKFRSMRTGDESKGSLVTAGGDPRITPLGIWLRKTKIDELPQLMNVLAGDMSFVGPRPEVPKYTARYTDEQKLVLLAKPGITCPSIEANEEELLASQADPETFYVTKILPAKLELHIAYMENIRFWNDLKVIVATVSGIFARIPSLFRAQPGVSRKAARMDDKQKMKLSESSSLNHPGGHIPS